jgi:ribonuclease HI
MEQYNDRLAIYTDGSKDLSGRVGASFCIPEINIECFSRISDNLSVYSSELIALSDCVSWLEENNSNTALSNNRGVVIFTDSLSSVVSIESRRSQTRPNLVFNIVQNIDCLYDTGRDVTIVWVPSHVGLSGNESADRLAKQALLVDSIQSRVPFESLEVNECINRFVNNKWQARLNASDKGVFNRSICPNVSCAIKYECDNKNKETLITRLRLGKCLLNKYLHAIGKHANGLCNTCKVEESIEHYLTACVESGLGEKIKAICDKRKMPFELNVILNDLEILDVIFNNVNRTL